MKYEARGVCQKCGKEVVRLWEENWSKFGAEDTSMIACPYCQDSKVTLKVSTIEDQPRHNLRSGWSRGY